MSAERLATILTILASLAAIGAALVGFAFYLAGIQIRDNILNRIEKLRNEIGDFKDVQARESARIYNLRVQTGLHENMLDDIQNYLEKSGFKRRKNNVPENTDFK